MNFTEQAQKLNSVQELNAQVITALKEIKPFDIVEITCKTKTFTVIPTKQSAFASKTSNKLLYILRDVSGVDHEFHLFDEACYIHQAPSHWIDSMGSDILSVKILQKVEET